MTTDEAREIVRRFAEAETNDPSSATAPDALVRAVAVVAADQQQQLGKLQQQLSVVLPGG